MIRLLPFGAHSHVLSLVQGPEAVISHIPTSLILDRCQVLLLIWKQSRQCDANVWHTEFKNLLKQFTLESQAVVHLIEYL